MKTRFYYTFAEVYSDTESAWTSAKNPFYAKLNSKTFKIFLDGVAQQIVFTESTYTPILFQKYLFPVVNNEYIAYIDVEHGPYEVPTKPEVWSTDTTEQALATSMRLEFAGKLFDWLMETQPYYEKLIALYTAQENNLLNKIESVSVSKFNDTPQNNAVGYDDTHTTTATQTTNTSDVETLINRLNDIRKKWDNLYREWAESFHKAFIIEVL